MKLTEILRFCKIGIETFLSSIQFFFSYHLYNFSFPIIYTIFLWTYDPTHHFVRTIVNTCMPNVVPRHSPLVRGNRWIGKSSSLPCNHQHHVQSCFKRTEAKKVLGKNCTNLLPSI